MRCSLAVVYVLAFLPCVASTDEHLPRIATHVTASSLKLEEHELYRQCEEPIHSRSATPSLPARDCRMRPERFAPSIAHQFIQSVSRVVFSDAHIQPIPARCAYLCWLRRSVSLRVAARDGGGVDSRQCCIDSRTELTRCECNGRAVLQLRRVICPVTAGCAFTASRPRRHVDEELL